MSRRNALLRVAILVAIPKASAFAQDATQSPQSWAIETVVVTGQRSSYATPVATTALRSETPLIQTPQSVEVLTRTLLDEQDRRTLSDALADISGAVPAKSEETVLNQPIIRGFEAEIFIDGLPVFGLTPIVDPASLINVQSIEVVKGPTGSLYGGGLGAPLGGLINLTSKTPTNGLQGFLEGRGGSFGTGGVSFDVSSGLDTDGSVRARLTGEYQHADSDIDKLASDRGSIYPTLSWSIDPRTELTLRAQYSDISQLEYSGLPAAITVAGPLLADRYHFSGASNAPHTNIENGIVTAALTHSFTDAVSGQVTGRYYDSTFREYGSFIYPSYFPPLAPTQYALLTGYLPTTSREWTVDGDLNAKFDLAGIANRAVGGLTYDQAQYHAALGFNFFPIGVIDYANPASDASFGAAPPVTSFETDRYTTIASYIQDEVQLDRLHLVGSARYTELNINQKELGLDKTYSKLTPRAAATFDIVPGLAAYGGYSEGFRGTINFYGSVPPVPETSQNLEGGLKIAAESLGLSGTLAYFDLTRQHVPVTDPANPFLSIQSGEQRSRGAEADLIWEPTRSLSLLAAYAYTEADVTKDTSIPVGSELPRVPKNSLRLAARYRFESGTLSGLGIGAGLSFVSRRQITLPNSFTAPGYTTLDAQASYDVGRYTLGVSIINLANEQAFDPYQYLGQPVVMPIQPRSVYFSLKAKI